MLRRYVKGKNGKSEEINLHVGQKRPCTPKIGNFDIFELSNDVKNFHLKSSQKNQLKGSFTNYVTQSMWVGGL